jgi:hypothetical protein
MSTTTVLIALSIPATLLLGSVVGRWMRHVQRRYAAIERVPLNTASAYTGEWVYVDDTVSAQIVVVDAEAWRIHMHMSGGPVRPYDWEDEEA